MVINSYIISTRTMPRKPRAIKAKQVPDAIVAIHSLQLDHPKDLVVSNSPPFPTSND